MAVLTRSAAPGPVSKASGSHALIEFVEAYSAQRGLSVRNYFATFTSRIFYLRNESARKGYFLKALEHTTAESAAIEAAFDRELIFYRHVYPGMPAGITATLVDVSHPDARQKFVLLEDLSATHDPVEWPCPPTRAQTIMAVAQLAKLHVSALEGTRPYRHALSSNEKCRNSRVDLENSLPRFLEFLRERIASAQLDKLAALARVRSAPAGPKSVLLGDSHFWNVMYGKNCTSALLVDWQDWSIGPPVADLAYMISLGVCPSVRDAGFRRRHFEGYLAQWKTMGGPHIDEELLWEEMLKEGLVRAARTAVYQWNAGLNAQIWSRTLSTLFQLPEFEDIREWCD